MMKLSIRNVAATLLWGGLLLAGTAQAQSVDPRGYIYGSIETRSDNRYTGFLRWGTEETFWDDLFNASKQDLPYMKHADDAGRDGRIRIFGRTIRYNWNDSSGRVLIARFGDIERIRPGRGERVELVMKGGSVHRIEGGSNDIGARITVQDASLGAVQIEWDEIREIVFSQAPNDARPEAFRLRGRLVTVEATFEGFIQWDSQECLSTDKLDGDTEDGELSIEMGKIRKIEKNDRHGSWVELKDGRRFLLEDSNDVDSSIRGIFVEDQRYGRVEVGWEAFRSVEFSTGGPSGRGYDEYGPARPLTGTVTDFEGHKLSGRIVYDLDESESWELLNGDQGDVEYNIPFERIRSVRPGRRDTSTVVLDSGTELSLEDGQDVAGRNAGVVVVRPGNEREVFVRWRDVERIDFDGP